MSRKNPTLVERVALFQIDQFNRDFGFANYPEHAPDKMLYEHYTEGGRKNALKTARELIAFIRKELDRD